jgi:NAD(P)-dependent dehydrogenase (short-subunit alcohol dehydrogenase family)
MSNRLSDKVAVITGGNSGIGFATAKEFMAEGAKVIITGRKQAALTEAAAALGAGVHTVHSDTGDMGDIRGLKSKVAAITPTIDILFINAGIGKFASIEQVDEAHFDEQFSVNVKGAYFTIQQLLPLINDGGSIILNTSISAHIGMPGGSVYAATKAALITLARSLSAELLSRRIRVNAISPGPVKTSILNKLDLPAEQVQEMKDRLETQVPLGRFGNPEEIAKVAVFFASEDSSFVLGAELIADGGMYNL